MPLRSQKRRQFLPHTGEEANTGIIAASATPKLDFYEERELEKECEVWDVFREEHYEGQ